MLFKELIEKYEVSVVPTFVAFKSGDMVSQSMHRYVVNYRVAQLK